LRQEGSFRQGDTQLRFQVASDQAKQGQG
jgi:hypothetical protein